MITKHPGIEKIVFRVDFHLTNSEETFTTQITLEEMNKLVVSGDLPQAIKECAQENIEESVEEELGEPEER